MTTELLPCPFCGEVPSTIERPDNIDGTEFFFAVACYCGGYSACAHKMAKRKTKEAARIDACAAWNRRAALSQAAEPTKRMLEQAGTDDQLATDLEAMRQGPAMLWTAQENHTLATAVRVLRELSIWREAVGTNLSEAAPDDTENG
jgi:Lar family restriction alleviation protein